MPQQGFLSCFCADADVVMSLLLLLYRTEEEGLLDVYRVVDGGVPLATYYLGTGEDVAHGELEEYDFC